MRMHSYGKCNINLAAGALSIFLLVVLYNYWNVSTLNRDLALKIHSLEQQIISFSRANDGLSLNLEQVKGEKTQLQNTLVKEEAEEKASRDQVAQKEKIIREIQNDLDNAKLESQNCREEVTALEAKSQSHDKEVAELKEKIVSLEGQLVEKTSQSDRVDTELSEAKEKIESLQKQLIAKGGTPAAQRSTAASVGAKPVVAPDENGQQQEQPVFNNDPAEMQMNPSVMKDKPEPLRQPLNADDTGGENPKDNEGVGVLPLPGQEPGNSNSNAAKNNNNNNNQPQQAPAPPQGGNLDAAEDDGDRQMKEDQALQDDQSPDGALPKENNANVIPVPIKSDVLAPPVAHSGQDAREDAHLNNNNV